MADNDNEQTEHEGEQSPHAASSGDPLQDEQVRQALWEQYGEVVAYGDTHGAELSSQPDEQESHAHESEES